MTAPLTAKPKRASNSLNKFGTMQNYQQFLERIFSFETKELNIRTPFVTNNSVNLKVDPQNRFRNFYGDTTVFNLEDPIKDELARYTAILYQAVPNCWAEPLRAETFHVTLHDLSNSAHLEEIASQTYHNEINLLKLLSQTELAPQEIEMRTTFVFNMVNTSLCLGLCPSNEEEYKKWMILYNLLEKIRPLPYPSTPHITLAYYSPQGFDELTCQNLRECVRQLNERTFSIILKTNNLYYQKFLSMNEYINIFKLIP